MKKKDLWLSNADYQSFSLPTFRNHIYKEEMRQKRIAKYHRDRERDANGDREE
jgi:hypothetical protein